MVVFVHTADWQFGMRRHYLEGEAQSRFAQSRLDAVAAVGQLAHDVGAAFVTVGGDAFDDNQVDRTTVLRAVEVLAAFPAIPILMLPGNHDAYDAGSVYRRSEFLDRLPSNVRIITDSEPVEVVPGVEVVGGPFPVRHPVSNPLIDAIDDLQPTGGVRVLLGHGNLDAVAGDQDQVALMRLAEIEPALADHRAHFVALGDRHSATSVGATGRVWFAGAPEPTSYREDRSGTALVVTVDRDHVDVDVRNVGRWSYRQRVFDVGSGDDIDVIIDWLGEPPDKPHTVASLAVRGTVSLADDARLAAALDDARATYGALEIWDRHHDLVSLPTDDDLDEMKIGGFVASALQELRGDAEGDQDAADALALLYRLAVNR